jgi:hypothetical protein
MDQVLRTIRTNFPYPPTFNVQLRMPTFLDVAITAKVYLRKNYAYDEVRAQAIAAFTDYFALYNADGTNNDRVNFGFYYETGAADSAQVLPLSDLMNSLRDCDSIQRLGVYPADFVVMVTSDNNTGAHPTRLAANSHQDIPILAHEFPRFFSLTLIDGANGTVF